MEKLQDLWKNAKLIKNSDERRSLKYIGKITQGKTNICSIRIEMKNIFMKKVNKK